MTQAGPSSDAASRPGTSHRIAFTEPMLRDAVRTFVWRRGVAAQKGLWGVFAAMLALLLWLVWRGDRSWLVGLVGASVLLVPLFTGPSQFMTPPSVRSSTGTASDPTQHATQSSRNGA